MGNLYIRLKTGFYSHRKTVKLRSIIGLDAYWIPPRVWVYAAEFQPDGNLSSYSAEELAMLIAYPSNAQVMLQALKDCGFISQDGMIHDWVQHNGYHQTFSERAKKAAEARWSKAHPASDCDLLVGEDTEKDIDIGDKHCSSIAPSIPEKSAKAFPTEVYQILDHLNVKASRSFRAIDQNLALIQSRLSEKDVTVEGILMMVDRMCAKWKADPEMSEYLRPTTLFGKQKFDGYYSNRALPVQAVLPVKTPHPGYQA